MSHKECAPECSASAGDACGGEENEQDRKLRSRLQSIRHTVLVLSGKGGVGKSTVAVNLATSLALSGKRVGLLDIDFHGPSVPRLLGLTKERAVTGAHGLLPVQVGDLKVMSISFLLGDDEDAAVIWRGPMKMGAIRQLLADVDWGELDVLVIDSPPGTGDEPLSVCQLIGGADGALVVTTPQDLSLGDVRRSITFCRQLELPVLGVIENMSGFVCPGCGEVADIFKSGGGETMARDMNVPFLGRIPLDPAVVRASDNGQAYMHQNPDSPAAVAFAAAIHPITELSADEEHTATRPSGETPMRIAIPVAEGSLSMHFGHCETFAVLEVDPTARAILGRKDVTPPAHAPGVLPKWLAEQNVNVILAGGMGSRAQGLFAEHGIDVVVGAPAETPEVLAQAYLDGTLATGANSCDH